MRLQQEGFKVTSTGRNLNAGKRLSQNGLNFIAADLRDYAQVSKILSGQEVIIHCAALTKSYGKYAEFFESNILVTRNLAKASLENSIKRFVNISSPSIYMSHENKFDICESDKLPDKQINFYSLTKKLAEEELKNILGDKIPWVTLRPQAIFGPGDQTLLPRLVKLAKQGSYPVIGKEPVWLDLSYVDNVADAIYSAISSPNINQEAFNITNGEPVILSEFLKKLFQKLGIEAQAKQVSYFKAYSLAKSLELAYKILEINKEPAITPYAVCALGKSRTLSIRKAQQELGYRPRVSLAEGLKRTIDSLSLSSHSASQKEYKPSLRLSFLR